MRKKIVILGGGTGGTLVANRLRRALGDEGAGIVVVDQDDRHVYQPGLLFVPFGLAEPAELTRPRHRQLHAGIGFRQAGVGHVDLGAQTVSLDDGATLGYDVLIVATGAQLLPGETEGLAEAMAAGTAFTFYTPDGAAALHDALARFEGGRIAVNVVDMPIKCPVAPLEFCFLADWYFHERKIRDRVELTYVTPLDGAFTKPVASAHLGGLRREKTVGLITEFTTGSVSARGLTSWDDRQVQCDLAVVIPLHGGADYVSRSGGLGDELGFIPVDVHTLQSKAAPNVFAIGDATGLPASKAGSVTHFEGEVLVENVRRFLAGEPLDASFDGHANCFIETGFGKALLIDFNYEVEPLAGHYPGPVGLPLLKQSRLNHLGKLMFQSFYWHGLLPGRDIPGVGSAMPTRGKPGLSADGAPGSATAGHTEAG